MLRLRVWWIPQVPGKPFLVPVDTLVEGKRLLNVLANYDLFQLENNIKPDYSNVGGLSVFDPYDKEDGPDGSWLDWEDSDGNSIDELDEAQLQIIDKERI